MYEKCRHKQKNRKTHYFRLIFRRFRKNGFFSERPRVLDVKAVFQDLDGVCQGVNVLSPDIFDHAYTYLVYIFFLFSFFYISTAMNINSIYTSVQRRRALAEAGRYRAHRPPRQSPGPLDRMPFPRHLEGLGPPPALRTCDARTYIYTGGENRGGGEEGKALGGAGFDRDLRFRFRARTGTQHGSYAVAVSLR